jgi:hypothetical protein
MSGRQVIGIGTALRGCGFLAGGLILLITARSGLGRIGIAEEVEGSGFVVVGGDIFE